jgi:hypothetical protein
VSDIYRRCGCRDEHGKQLGQSCPKLKSDPKHGTWSYHLSAGADPKTNKRHQFHKTAVKTKRPAEAAAAELKTWTRAPTPSRARKHWAYALEWLPRRERSDKGLRATTVAGYEYCIKEDISRSALGGMKLTDIRRYHVSEFVADQVKAGRGTVTVRRLVTLRGPSLAVLSKMS